MTQIYLIDMATMLGYEDISSNVKEERIKLFIRKAQDLDLEPFLGQAFYYDLLDQFDDNGVLKDDAAQKYKDLIDGVKYQDANGHTIMFAGLKPMLVYFTFARFIEADSVRYTSTGPVTKQHDNADPVPIKDIVKLVQQQRSVANAYANKVEKFLMDKRGDYPLYRFSAKNKTARQPGPRIRGIDKTDYNYSGSGVANTNFPGSEFL